MALINQRSGCKVGWLTFDNEAEAREAAERAKEQARDAWSRGYDFGYQCPGEVVQRREYVDPHDTSKGYTLLEEWTVTTP